MKEKIIASYEDELGIELYKLFIPKEVEEEEINKALEMASKYANADSDICDDEEAKSYGLDKNWKKIYDEYISVNGEERFFGYLELVYGWKSETMQCDYSFNW